VELLRKVRIPFGVVINRAGMGDDRVQNYLENENISLLGTLPHSLEAANAYSKGSLLINQVQGYALSIADIAGNIHTLAASESKS